MNHTLSPKPSIRLGYCDTSSNQCYYGRCKCILDLILVRYLSFSGLALATSLVAVLNCICLFISLRENMLFMKRPYLLLLVG